MKSTTTHVLIQTGRNKIFGLNSDWPYIRFFRLKTEQNIYLKDSYIKQMVCLFQWNFLLSRNRDSESFIKRFNDTFLENETWSSNLVSREDSETITVLRYRNFNNKETCRVVCVPRGSLVREVKVLLYVINLIFLPSEVTLLFLVQVPKVWDESFYDKNTLRKNVLGEDTVRTRRIRFSPMRSLSTVTGGTTLVPIYQSTSPVSFTINDSLIVSWKGCDVWVKVVDRDGK